MTLNSHTLMISNSYLLFFELSKIIRKFADRNQNCRISTERPKRKL